MATRVVMEALSPTMEEGRLVAWKKREGDVVRSGETLAEVETDKAIMELVARAGGVLRKIAVPEGATVPVGALIAVIAAADEDVSALVESGGPRAGAGGAAASTSGAQPGAGRPDERGAAAIGTPAGRVRSSPLARRLAAAKGLDPELLTGSGPGGRVIKRDVDAAAAAPPLAPAPLVAPPPAGFEDVPLSPMRKTIARRLAQALGPIPHFYLTSEIDMERAAEARAHLKSLGDAPQISFNDLVIKAAALALRRHPAVNASFLDDRIRYHADVHVGIAVALDDGLITPVIRFADRKGLADIAAEARSLADRARARRLKPEEYGGATFSVSNLGMLDIDEFTAVINPPEAAILAVGRITSRPAVVAETVVPRRTMRVTLSCDHRVIDGATGAKFLQTVRLMLENPLAMLL